MPKRMKSKAIITRNQKIPPLRKTHEACRKLKSFPKKTHAYVEEYHAIRITIIKSNKPKINSSHLFMDLT